MGSSFHNQYSLENTLHTSRLTTNSIMSKKLTGKRKFNTDLELGTWSNNLSIPNGTRNRVIKRQKNPNAIFGQRLPLNRIIETLNKEKLQNLINNLVNENPELTTKILNASPNITPTDALRELQRKLDIILANIPYKVDSTSDYSFLRVKPLINEFFQSLSDYSLNFIAPIEHDLTISISFLKNFLMEIFHKLPQFTAVEFKYFYNVTVEKFNLIFSNNILQFLEEKKQNLLLIINENWLDDFKKINELNNNNFNKIQLLLEDAINKYYASGSVILSDTSLSNSSVSNVLNDSDYKDNKLSGLDNLLNFAYQNNPLSNSTTLNNI